MNDEKKPIQCNSGCAACCVVISISSAIPGMPEGKPAGMRCVNLDAKNLCRIHGTAEYPAVCRNFKPTAEMCGQTTEQSWSYLTKLEEMTK